ncbi:MAG: polysaccharide deacetylase family protein [Pyrinomonadaceae bacterium]
MTQSKPFASLSLDLDNQWSYMKTHGDAGWESFPSYLDVVVPRVNQFMRERNLRLTYFVVGQDAALEKNHDAFAQLSDSGTHEIGNHSFHHQPWLHLYTAKEFEDELTRAEEAIVNATNYHPRGFRGPGFSFSRDVLLTLARRSYEYDASTFPTYLGPLARAYYFATAKLNEEQTAQRKQLFGKLSDGWRSVKPYKWRIDAETSLLEIPVTTMPIFKIPMHVSYILYLSGYSKSVAMQFWRTSLGLCRLTKTEPSLLLHPLDFLGCDDVRELAFFPGMNIKSHIKAEIVSEILEMLNSHFQIVPMREHAHAIAAKKLPMIESKMSAPTTKSVSGGLVLKG